MNQFNIKAWVIRSKFVLFSMIIFLALSASIEAKTTTQEKKLVISMKLNKVTKARIGDSGQAIKSYITKGYLRKKPNSRFDYTDSWVLKKPASFLGHRLLVIEEEYMGKYVGCCVSPGVGVILKVKGSISTLKKFSRKNGCSLEMGISVRSRLRSLKVGVNKANKYVSMSCRERDIPDSFVITTNEVEYLVNYNSHGAVLTSVNSKEKVYLGNKCDASSKLYGKGVWSEKHGGFTVQFGKKKIIFPSQEMNIEGSQGC